MIRFRPFRNSDPPGIAQLWQSQPPLRGVVHTVSAARLDMMVLAKTYFDREGLIVAVDGEQVVGFAHAGFGPTDDGARLATETGATCLLMVAERPDRSEIAGELLRLSEAYLQHKGAKDLYAGGPPAGNPFYLGLCGGSESVGLLESDAAAVELYCAAGYEAIGQRTVLQLQLASFRPAVNRQSMQIKRTHTIENAFDPPPKTWWDACTTGQMDRTQFFARARGEKWVASATFWDMEPLASSWGAQAAGLLDLTVVEDERRKGIATFLLGEALKQLQSQGVKLVETYGPNDDRAATGLLEKLGFAKVDQAIVLRKAVG